MSIRSKSTIIQVPTDGTDDDRWMGMTREEVAKWLRRHEAEARRLREKWLFDAWVPGPGDTRH